jgi:drug/metabolite transporter (DMT)-like permease
MLARVGRNERVGLAFAVATAFFYAGVILLGKLALTSRSPASFAVFFFAFGGCWYVVYFAARARWRAFRPSAGLLSAALVISVIDAVHVVAILTGLKLLHPATAAFFGHLTDLFAALVGLIILRERASARELCGMLLVLVGLVSMTAQTEGVVLAGLAWTAFGAVFYAGNAVLIRRATRRHDAVELAFYRCLIMALLMIGLTVATSELALPSGREWLLLPALGLVGPFLNYLCFFSALKYLEVSRVAVIRMSYSVVVLCVSLAVFADPPSARQAAGGLAVFLGVAWVLLEKARLASASAATPTAGTARASGR